MLRSPDAPETALCDGTLEAMLAKARASVPGPFLEVGVWKGGGAWYLGQITQEQGRELWLYDTFAGIPYRGPLDSHRIGDFADCDYAEVVRAIPHAHVIMGIFPESALGTREGGPRFFPAAPVAFAHIDCDQERAYRETIRFLTPRMAAGGVMWFDDAPCLEGAQAAVRAAFPEERLQMTCGKWWVQF